MQYELLHIFNICMSGAQQQAAICQSDRPRAWVEASRRCSAGMPVEWRSPWGRKRHMECDCANKLAVYNDGYLDGGKKSHAFIACRGCQALACYKHLSLVAVLSSCHSLGGGDMMLGARLLLQHQL
ncbi:uncharacterized protein LOC120683966 [Panicum virgatum]|uniref:uncharacterized protein LOC120683966 n=1 Tax=Panicum virgatum TaxID=38727 RepID=UPI0019D61387|nr:uncharacterized protein LOC120683966 [Panicum virgatum]